MIEIQVPDLGENVEEAEVIKILVQEGDTVSEDQAILEFETEKATFEMPSRAWIATYDDETSARSH